MMVLYLKKGRSSQLQDDFNDAVLFRDKQCTVCDEKRGLEAAHLFGVKEKKVANQSREALRELDCGVHSLFAAANGITLCCEHHTSYNSLLYWAIDPKDGTIILSPLAEKIPNFSLQKGRKTQFAAQVDKSGFPTHQLLEYAYNKYKQ